MCFEKDDRVGGGALYNIFHLGNLLKEDLEDNFRLLILLQGQKVVGENIAKKNTIKYNKNRRKSERHFRFLGKV
jgi:hypothetical protein